MRDYGKVGPTFWSRGTGKELRGDPSAQLVALYLMTCPSANMVGLYYLPLALLAHETGLTAEGASKALRRVSEAHFAYYDDATETVWVPRMAAYQIGDVLKAKDKRREGVIRELHVVRKSPFVKDFFDRYARAYGLPLPDWVRSPFEAPSKPLRSQDQDQDQEQEHEQDLARARARGPEPEPEDPTERPSHVRVVPALPAGDAVPPARTLVDLAMPMTDSMRDTASMAGVLDPDRAFVEWKARKKSLGWTSSDWEAAWLADVGAVARRERTERDRAYRDRPGDDPEFVDPQSYEASRRRRTREDAEMQAEIQRRLAKAGVVNG